jgi:hypothetical protein
VSAIINDLKCRITLVASVMNVLDECVNYPSEQDNSKNSVILSLFILLHYYYLLCSVQKVLYFIFSHFSKFLFLRDCFLCSFLIFVF